MFSLTKLIETKRKQLFYLGKLYGLTHPKTIQCSQQLDVLINFSLQGQSTTIKRAFYRKNENS
ncbi:aspartyl-phosphate phosphatase Spo0E family protein [Ectobacillus funiculus]|uniref:aspartyl-phosphate phosphatase Spo0E family protein n=1 Tax=Ectobacillus funiculus TaxID=137993 RepID=UPI00397BAA59